MRLARGVLPSRRCGSWITGRGFLEGLCGRMTRIGNLRQYQGWLTRRMGGLPSFAAKLAGWGSGGNVNFGRAVSQGNVIPRLPPAFLRSDLRIADREGVVRLYPGFTEASRLFDLWFSSRGKSLPGCGPGGGSE